MIAHFIKSGAFYTGLFILIIEDLNISNELKGREWYCSHSGRKYDQILKSLCLGFKVLLQCQTSQLRKMAPHVCSCIFHRNLW